MRTPDEPGPARWRPRGGPGRRIITAALTVTTGLLLAAGLSIAPARAAVTSSAAKAPPARSATPLALTNCLKGVSDGFEFYTWCRGTSPTSFRTIAFCTNGDAVIGLEYADGSGSISYADCTLDNQPNNMLQGTWGLLYCSNDNGTGTYAGYTDVNNDISGLLLTEGKGEGIAAGGTLLCQYSTGQSQYVSETTPLTSSS